MANTGIANILLLVVFIGLIYFMMIRPQRKKDKADREMRAALGVGDEIITIGGVVGKITKVTDSTIIITTGADKTKIEFLKTAVASAVRGDGSKAEVKKEQKEKEEPAEEKRPDRDKKVTPKKLTRKSENSDAEAAE